MRSNHIVQSHRRVLAKPLQLILLLQKHSSGQQRYHQSCVRFRNTTQLAGLISLSIFHVILNLNRRLWLPLRFIAARARILHYYIVCL